MFSFYQLLSDDDFNGDVGLPEENLDFLATNIPPNVEKLRLKNQDIRDHQIKILLSRCKKIKALSLEAHFMTDTSLSYIRQYLNLTLEELRLTDINDEISFHSFLELKSMARHAILNLPRRAAGSSSRKPVRTDIFKMDPTTTPSKVTVMIYNVT